MDFVKKVTKRLFLFSVLSMVVFFSSHCMKKSKNQDRPEQLIAIGSNCKVEIFDADTLGKVTDFTVLYRPMNYLEFDPNNPNIIACGNINKKNLRDDWLSISIIRISNKEVIKTIRKVLAFAFDPHKENSIAFCDNEDPGIVKIGDYDQQYIRKLTVNSTSEGQTIREIKFSPAEKNMLLVSTGKEVFIFNGEKERVINFDYSIDKIFPDPHDSNVFAAVNLCFSGEFLICNINSSEVSLCKDENAFSSDRFGALNFNPSKAEIFFFSRGVNNVLQVFVTNYHKGEIKYKCFVKVSPGCCLCGKFFRINKSGFEFVTLDIIDNNNCRICKWLINANNANKDNEIDVKIMREKTIGLYACIMAVSKVKLPTENKLSTKLNKMRKRNGHRSLNDCVVETQDY